MSGLREKAKKIGQKIKRKAWDEQPDIKLFYPINIEVNPQPIPFEVAMREKSHPGFLLRTPHDLREDNRLRTLSTIAHTNYASIPAEWASHLKPPFEAFLFQIQDRLGIAFLGQPQEGGDRDG